MDMKFFENMFEEVPSPITQEERKNWMKNLKDVCLGSDAFFPFRDNIDRAFLVT